MMTYTPTKYMDHTHPDAFVDHERMQPAYGCTVECPRCKGFGGWNLQLNAYGLPAGEADTPENRKKFVHFRAICGHCNGWGFVSPEETCQGHDWKWIKNVGNCLNRYECIHCKKTSDVDSSD